MTRGTIFVVSAVGLPMAQLMPTGTMVEKLIAGSAQVILGISLAAVTWAYLKERADNKRAAAERIAALEKAIDGRESAMSQVAQAVKRNSEVVEGLDGSVKIFAEKVQKCGAIHDLWEARLRRELDR